MLINTAFTKGTYKGHWFVHEWYKLPHKYFSLQKIPSYSLQILLVTRCRSCLLQKITRYSLRNSLVNCCKKQLVTRCRSFSLQKIICHSLKKQSYVNKVRRKFQFFSIYGNLFPKTKIFKVVPSQHITLKYVFRKTLSNTIIYKSVKTCPKSNK